MRDWLLVRVGALLGFRVRATAEYTAPFEREILCLRGELRSREDENLALAGRVAELESKLKAATVKKAPTARDLAWQAFADAYSAECALLPAEVHSEVFQGAFNRALLTYLGNQPKPEPGRVPMDLVDFVNFAESWAKERFAKNDPEWRTCAGLATLGVVSDLYWELSKRGVRT